MTQNRTFQEQASRRVSFIMTTKNRAEFIGKALEMARKLVGPEDELIVIDGASTDGTVEIVASFGDLVDVFISEPDACTSHALNKGMLAARGKYIKHITDDDEFFPDAMEHAIEVIEAHTEVDVLICGGLRQIGDKISPVYMPSGVNFGKSPEDVFKYGVCGCGFLIRRSVLSQTGLASYTSIAADAEYIARAIYNRANVKFCRINLFHHPIYEHSYIVAHKSAHQRDLERIVKQYCSVGFYWRYRLRRMAGRTARRYVVLRWPVLGTRQVLRRALAALRRGRRTDRYDQENPIWDGGFS